MKLTQNNIIANSVDMTIYTCKAMSARDKLVFRANTRLFVSWFLLNRAQKTVSLVEHSNSGEKVSIRFDSIRQSDKFAACTQIFK